MLKCLPLAWMHARICICVTHQVHDVTVLKQRLTKVCHVLGQSVIDDAMDEWHRRLWACVHVKGGHFEHDPRAPICQCLEANLC